MKNKKILFLSTQLPFPPISGGVIKSYHYINHLSKTNEVTLACFLKNDDIDHLNKYSQKHAIYKLITIPLQIKRSAWSLLMSYFKSTSLNNYRNKSARFKSIVKRSSEKKDVILIDHYEMFQYVPKNFKGKIILHTHNAEFALWKRMAECEKRWLYKVVLNAEAKRVKKAEQFSIIHSDLVYATPSDINLYKENFIFSNNYRYTYHLGDVELLKKAALQFGKTENSILFVGTLTWEPNVNGLLWFLKNVWPILLKDQPNTKFYIVGKNPDERLMECKTFKNVVFTGFVENLEEYYGRVRIAIIPLLFGSGMKVKLLEAMYRGLPTVSTTVGAEGVELENKKDIFIEDDAIAFAEKIGLLLNDKDKWEKFSRNSRNIAAEKYTWERLFKDMDLAADSLFT